MTPIRLMQSTFYKEEETKKFLCDFIMRSEKLSMGENVSLWEEKFASWQQAKHAVGFNSGSSANLALIQALLNLGRIKKGDAVAFSAVTWATNPMPLIQLGLKPIAVDIELENLNMSLATLKKCLLRYPEVKCVFITNLLGFCADIDQIEQFCLERNIVLIEDNCESFGSVHCNRKLGNFGVAATFSTFVGHHLSTIEGGMVCTSDEDLKDALLMTRAHGWSRNLSSSKRKSLRESHDISSFYDQYTFYELGFNLRPTEITGVIGARQIDYADEIVSRRAKNFAIFHRTASKNSNIVPLKIDHMNLVSNFAYPVVAKNKEMLSKFVQRFADLKIEIRPLVAGNILRQPFFKKYVADCSFEVPVSDIVHDCGFYFPNHPDLLESELNRITQALSD